MSVLIILCLAAFQVTTQLSLLMAKQVPVRLILWVLVVQSVWVPS